MLYPVTSRRVRRNAVMLSGLGENEDLEQANAFITEQLAVQGYKPVATTGSQADMSKVEEVVQKAAIESAVHQAVLTIALNAIPVVGTALSALAGLAFGSSSKKYQDRLKDYIQKKVAEINAYTAKKQKEVDDAVTAAYRQARSEGFRLAISFQSVNVHEGGDAVMLNPYMNGLGGLGDLDGVLDKYTGKSAYEAGKKEIDAQVAATRKSIDDATTPLLAKIRSPGFKALLAQTIAIEARKRPDFIAQLRGAGIPPPPAKYMTHKTTGSEAIPTQGVTPLKTAGPNGYGEVEMPTKTTLVPIIAAAAAIGAVLLLK